jgi:hypothetical protein
MADIFSLMACTGLDPAYPNRLLENLQLPWNKSPNILENSGHVQRLFEPVAAAVKPKSDKPALVEGESA